MRWKWRSLAVVSIRDFSPITPTEQVITPGKTLQILAMDENSPPDSPSWKFLSRDQILQSAGTET
jgi:hypothetical protein